MDPTGQGLTKLLKRKRLDNLLNELESDPESFEGGKKMTKAQLATEKTLKIRRKRQKTMIK